ncbi:MAG: tetratricopeptide repeat protein [Elusimicrobia bacterium]|nr:tetratricopeptide repeat protein [Elusimicrobiota bacterium]
MTLRAIQWVKAHKGVVLTVSFILVLAVILGGAFIIQIRELEDRGWQLLSGGQYLSYQGQTQEAHKYFGEIETRHLNSKLGDFGLLMNATLYAREGQWAQAEERYRSLLNRKKVKPLLPIATIGLARACEAVGKIDEARQHLESFLSLYPDHFSAPQAYESLARVYEMGGNFPKAKEQLERLRVLYPETVWAHRAETRLRLVRP